MLGLSEQVVESMATQYYGDASSKTLSSTQYLQQCSFNTDLSPWTPYGRTTSATFGPGAQQRQYGS
jgi:hypothetical protein